MRLKYQNSRVAYARVSIEVEYEVRTKSPSATLPIDASPPEKMQDCGLEGHSAETGDEFVPPLAIGFLGEHLGIENGRKCNAILLELTMARIGRQREKLSRGGKNPIQSRETSS
jgi:hypothetical protein